eukprot:TRINITY_DN1071_c4_g1_i1.p1 TRINITY_DN1071_c4_g1~~TRINITY_DN1071_c4_g1_i1.p1  ORF type:complete len:377 (-),score=74.85 TRINITY_DN1071_c4_g1_i1:10-1086(-)
MENDIISDEILARILQEEENNKLIQIHVNENKNIKLNANEIIVIDDSNNSENNLSNSNNNNNITTNKNSNNLLNNNDNNKERKKNFRYKNNFDVEELRIEFKSIINSINPDIYELFRKYNKLLFNDELARCELKFSNRMKLCAGLCEYKRGHCCIKLSEPILKFRTTLDMINTLLHEMIHAFLFVTYNSRDRDAHGPNFQFHQNRINTILQSNITIYHSFIDEVNFYRVHWWSCDQCNLTIKRSMNRKPSLHDRWWNDHLNRCPNGKFIKIKEPDNYKDKNKNKKTTNVNNNNNNNSDIRNFFKVGSKRKKSNSSSSGTNSRKEKNNKTIIIEDSKQGEDNEDIYIQKKKRQKVNTKK